jgi:hypothetical protein
VCSGGKSLAELSRVILENASSSLPQFGMSAHAAKEHRA